MRTIWIVMGETGEYSDKNEWIVGAFLDKKKAENEIEKLNFWCKENEVNSGRHSLSVNERARKLICPYDDSFRADYTGTEYSLMETTLNKEKA